MTELDWHQLETRFDPGLCQHMRRRLESHGRLDLSAEEVGAAANRPTEEAGELLERLVELGALERNELRETRCHECDSKIREADLVVDECPRCEQLLQPAALQWRTVRTYARDAPRGRDVPWVLVIHGMNTRGQWQEELSWRVGSTYGRSVPVYIHKYGRVRIGVLLRFRQRRLIDDLARTVREISGGAEDRGFGKRPDVIAHSFGTWLIGHLLLHHDDIELGRIILVGAVIAPDFDWQGLIDVGRVDAVLNHHGGRDRWVPFAAWAIPDAGPSGRRPLASGPNVVNREEAGFGHSSFFKEHLAEVHSTVWQPFLRQPPDRFPEVSDISVSDPWDPPPKVVTGLVRMLLIMMVALVLGLAAVACVLGVIQLAQVFR